MSRTAMHPAIVPSLVVASVVLSAASAAAQDPGSRPTREFAQAAASSDEVEILEAKTALAQSTNQDIRAFATQMIQDHQRTSQALVDAATRSGLKLPERAVSVDQAQSLSALQSLNGPDFDKTYAKQQALAHRSALTVQQIYAATGDDPTLREAAAAAVPLISSHAEMAEQMAAKLGGS